MYQKIAQIAQIAHLKVYHFPILLSESLKKEFNSVEKETNSVEKKSKSLELSVSRLLDCVSRLLELPPRLSDFLMSARA